MARMTKSRAPAKATMAAHAAIVPSCQKADEVSNKPRSVLPWNII